LKIIIRLFCTLWLLHLFLGVNVVQAQVQIEQSYYYDDTTKLTINDINAVKFQPFTDDLRQGILRGSTWIKLTISKSKDFDFVSSEYNVFPLVLGVGSFTLDHIELYEDVHGGWLTQVADQIEIQNPRICHDDLHCFNLKTRLVDEEVQNIYLKIDTQTIRIIHIELRPQNLLAAKSISRLSRISITVALGFCLFLLSLIFYIIERSRFLLVFALFELSIVCYLYVSSGINYSFFDFHPQLFVYSLSLTLFNCRLVLFTCLCYLAIVDYSPSKPYIFLSKLNFLAAGVCLILPIAGLRALSLEMNLAIQAFVVILNIYGVLTCNKLPFNIKTILLLGYLLYAFLFSIGFSSSMGLFDSSIQRFLGFARFYDFRLNGMPIAMVVFSIVILQLLTSKKSSYQALADAKINEAKLFFLNERLTEREEMVEVLSHEIKNPLSTIRFASNSIERNSAAGSDVQARALVINRSILRIDDLINQVYLSSQLDKNIFQKAIVEVNLLDLVTEVVGEFNAMHRFNLEIPVVLSVKTNESLLFNILTNLIGNSIKYAAPGTIIDVSISMRDITEVDTPSRMKKGEVAGKKIVILISNEVEAVNLPDPNMVFHRYYRHENFLAKPGMGIGLNIVKSATDLLGGHISCEVSNCIVSFTVEIPVS
jgi:hypothetical protein